MTATLNAHLNQTPPLAIDALTGGTRKYPGNVGVCLSGGGSRACTSAMGQLRALKHLTANGASLLSQVKALSTVSGGSWLGVTYTFLPDNVSDDDFLNVHVADPGELVAENGASVAVTLDQLPQGNMGNGLNSRLFAVPALAVEAFLLWKFKKTPPNMLWQTLMGMHLLSGYGLHTGGENALPTSYFTVDDVSLNSIRNENPPLDPVAGHVVASGPSQVPRPYLICNTSMFVDTPGGMGQSALVPVQATPWFTGVVSSPDAADANSKPVGGGGVTSFAFNSELTGADSADVQVSQARQWSLTDIVGASSAAFAAELEKILTDPETLLDHLVEYLDDAVDWVTKKIGLKLPFELPERHIPDFVKRSLLRRLLGNVDFKLGAIIPEYTYWPVRDASPEPAAVPSRFADGGNLENTGICGMLSYSDIDSIIAFVNSPTPMTAADRGVIDEHGIEVPGTRILVDGQIPPLFGYQPYNDGYVVYPADSTAIESRVCVFAPEKFPEFLKGLWSASGNEAAAGSNSRPAAFSQSLVTLQNNWFGVPGQKPVTVAWFYLNDVTDWQNKLQSNVRQLVQSTPNFPNYRTLNTGLSNTEINLLASLTAWSVAAPENSDIYTSLFKPGV